MFQRQARIARAFKNEITVEDIALKRTIGVNLSGPLISRPQLIKRRKRRQQFDRGSRIQRAIVIGRNKRARSLDVLYKNADTALRYAGLQQGI